MLMRSSVSSEDHESDLRIDLHVPDHLARDAQFVESGCGDVGQCPIDEVADARVLRFDREIQLIAPKPAAGGGNIRILTLVELDAGGLPLLQDLPQHGRYLRAGG